MENYELVQKGFRILHPLMAGYIGREFSRVYKENWWGAIREALSDQRDLAETGSYSELIDSLDIMNCLRIFDRCWNEVFRAKLSQDYRTWAKELLSVRNRLAHIGGQDFTQAYAERALDTMALMCEAFDAEGVDEIRALYRKLRYGSEEGSVAAGAVSVASSVNHARMANTANEGVLTKIRGGLPSWREVMQPHPDVAEGRYRYAEFAANLAQVARGEGAVEYRDPVEFFARTYVTEGMAGLLVQALQRLSGTGGEPVIQLKTSFGGGKTHSLLALYHASHGRIPVNRVPCLKPILERAGLTELPKANVAVLDGTAIEPTKRKNPPNLPKYTVNTIWGEMAYQLVISAGQPELYSIIADSDRKGVSPGSETLMRLFNACGPCLILMDELVAYGKKIYGVNGLPAGSFDNFITFIQEITEAARASKNSIVVASIPESDIEVGGDAGKIVLETIEHTFGRMESIWKPVAANEGFEVVRRRLFLDCEYPEKRDEICEEFSKLYRDNISDFPPETKELEYRNRMKSCYPIHPEVFDRLYGDWATLERFQRTRGVLRLMAAVIHELWMSNDASAMILPGSIPLNTPAVREELVRLLPDTWNSIIDREVDGKDSIPYQVDKSTVRYSGKMAARRVARTIMLGSAPSTSALRGRTLRGLESSRIRLGVVQPGENIADFNDALNTLGNSLSYLYTSQNGTRYWYDTKPTLRKTAEDRASQVTAEEVTKDLEARLHKLRKEAPLGGLHICPCSSNDVPDEQSSRLVILRPVDSFKRSGGLDSGRAMNTVTEILNMRGNSPRVYRNMLSFIAPDERKLFNLQKEVRRYLAWVSIYTDRDDLNLDSKQTQEVQDHQKQCDDAVGKLMGEVWCWLMVPYIDPMEDIKTVQWDINNLGGGSENIVVKAIKRMQHEEQLITKWAPMHLRGCLHELLWKDRNDISVKQLWEYLCTYSYLPKLANFAVLQDTIVDGVKSREYFGIAAGFEDGRYIDLRLGTNTSTVLQSDLLVRPEIAAEQIERGKQPSQLLSSESSQDKPYNPRHGGGFAGEDEGQMNPPPIVIREPPAPKNTRFFMSAKLDNTRASRNVHDYLTEVIQHLANVEGADVEMTLDVNVTVRDGIPTDVVRTVSENCHALHIQDFGFEDR